MKQRIHMVLTITGETLGLSITVEKYILGNHPRMEIIHFNEDHGLYYTYLGTVIS
jgi:hypothetical protein